MTFEISLEERRALVTGAGQGVGRAIAAYLAAAGASVAVNDAVELRARAVVDEIVAAGGTASVAPFDVTNWEDVQQRVEALDGVDILVNNAGGAGIHGWGQLVPFVETEPSSWEPFIQVNLVGAMNCVRAVLPRMIAAKHGRQPRIWLLLSGFTTASKHSLSR